MKFTSKEDNVLVVIGSTVALYDFFTIPFNSFLITTTFAGLLFYLTRSPFIVTFVYIVPQFINILNYLMGNSSKKEKFMNVNPTEISARIQKMKSGYKQEPFTNLTEVSNRVQAIKKEHVLPRVKEVSGVVDEPVLGNASIPTFMAEFENLGMNVETNTRIYTPTESSVPASGTQNNFPRNNIHVPVIDDISINTALAKTTTNNSTNSSNLKSVEIDGKST
uniref:Uncharacterized protein n=1 Tax=viral metagenome TaxID=1070528 RepID=A0A6C0D6Y6_9ZZZZ